MNDIWYYAEGDKSVGPLSQSDMIELLSRVPDVSDILVWRDNFSSWMKVENVAELAQHVIKPPPIPVSKEPPPIPVSVRRSRQTVIAAPTTPNVIADVRTHVPFETNKKDLVGIGGWLILVAIGQVLGPLKTSALILKYYTDLENDLWTKFSITFYGEAALNVSLLALIWYTTDLFFQKSILFPKFFIYEYIGTVLFYPIDWIFSAATLKAYTGQSIGTLLAPMMVPDAVGSWIAAIITAAIWIPYVRLSKRVANTFVN